MPLTRDQKIEIKDLIRSTIQEVFGKDSEFMSDLSATIADKVAIRALEQRVEVLQGENDMLRSILNSNEQFSRRRNMRIVGIGEDRHENIEVKVADVIRQKFKVDVQPSDIEHCRRIGRRGVDEGNDRPRAVLVEFANLKIKKKVMGSRKNLKSTGVVAYEDLTKRNHELFRECVAKLNKRSVWTNEGKIFIRLNDAIHVVKNVGDLQRLLN